MFGAIVGDTLGSIYEEIPNMPRRLSMSPTDDSVLTCACHEWCDNLDVKKVRLFESSGMGETNLLNRYAYSQELITEAIIVLKKWYAFYAPSKTISPNSLPPTIENGELLGFSKSFSRWAEDTEYTQSHKRTNGALMRQSPIAAWCVENQVGLDVCQNLAQIFASPTHDHMDTYSAVQSHITLLYRTLTGSLGPHNIHAFLATLPNQTSLAQWREKNMAHFIWDAPQSYDIVCAVLREANSFESAFDNCVHVGGDVDTYAAIMGPIAQTLWGIPEHMSKPVKDVLIVHPRIAHYYA